jgi:hypothetical protein
LIACLLLDVPDGRGRLLLGVGPFLGFLSHLVMDELWSVKWFGLDMGLKRSSGTALKLYSGSLVANLATYALLLGLCYVLAQDETIHRVIARWRSESDAMDVARELNDRLLR